MCLSVRAFFVKKTQKPFFYFKRRQKPVCLKPRESRQKCMEPQKPKGFKKGAPPSADQNVIMVCICMSEMTFLSFFLYDVHGKEYFAKMRKNSAIHRSKIHPPGQ